MISVPGSGTHTLLVVQFGYVWKFGGRWIGPFQIISRQGVNYKIRSMEGKDKVVHNNSLKTCVVPVDKGVPHYFLSLWVVVWTGYLLLGILIPACNCG